jgi:hypothetical protein
MSAHAPHISEDTLRHLPSQVSQVTQKLLLLVGVATTVISIAGEWAHGGHLLNHWLVDNVAALGALLNVLLVTLVLFPGRIHPLNGDVHDPTVRLAARCLNVYCLPALTWFWRCIGLLYVVQLFRNVTGSYPHELIALGRTPSYVVPLSAICIEVFSASSTLFILLAYVSLTPTFLRDYVENAKSPVRDQWRSCRAVWFCVALILPVALVMILARLFVMSTDNPTRVGNLATMANGLVSAIAFGFFVGRIDSKFVMNWQWVVPLLFGYAGIQVYATVLYDAAPFQQAAFVYAAFTMKCVLFIFLSNFFESRRILYYAVEVIELKWRDV